MVPLVELFRPLCIPAQLPVALSQALEHDRRNREPILERYLAPPWRSLVGKLQRPSDPRPSNDWQHCSELLTQGLASMPFRERESILKRLEEIARLPTVTGDHGAESRNQLVRDYFERLREQIAAKRFLPRPV